MFCSLLSGLSERHRHVCDEIQWLDGVDRSAAELADKIRRTQREVARADAWDRDSDAAGDTLKVSYCAVRYSGERLQLC